MVNTHLQLQIIQNILINQTFYITFFERSVIRELIDKSKRFRLGRHL